MANKYKLNDVVFIVVSNRVIREVKIINCSGEFYTLKFSNGGGGIKLRENRIFATKEEADASIQKTKPSPKLPPKRRYRTPWEY